MEGEDGVIPIGAERVTTTPYYAYGYPAYAPPYGMYPYRPFGPGFFGTGRGRGRAWW